MLLNNFSSQLFLFSKGVSIRRNDRYLKGDLQRGQLSPEYPLLKSIPGIGGIVAVGIISELGDLRRFNSLKQLAGYVGIAPGVHQSGASNKAMGMNPRSHRLIRSYFVEASWQAIRTDPVMQAYYRTHLGKDDKKIIIKIAHKLLSRTLAVIKTETPYEIGVVS
ncbi:transposase [Salinimicrobium sp. WS361]|uniref:transposase n=1 Tax=Salinimicrobium sp. WS361 TaxID=3425123 RepID=UPI003D6E428B